MKVEIRPLIIDDARKSWKWRNDPLIWKYTGSSPKVKITQNIEIKWIKEVLRRKDEKRFAICVDNIYVGNIQLTGITKFDAEYHIFIGDKKYWGRGIGKAATQLLIEFGFSELGLKEIYLWVTKLNKSAIRIYKSSGFSVKCKDGNMIQMVLKNKQV